MEPIIDRINKKTFEAGQLVKLHGISGSLVLRLSMPAEEIRNVPGWLFIRIWGQPVPFKVVDESVYQKDNRHLVIGLEGIDSQESARRLVGYTCCLEGQWSDWFSVEGGSANPWIGAEVTDATTGKTGTVISYNDIPGNPLIEIQISGKTILLPFNDDYILESDKNARKLRVRIPLEMWNL